MCLEAKQPIWRDSCDYCWYSDVWRYFWNHSGSEALLSKGAQLGTILSFMMAVTTLLFTVFDYAEKGGKGEAAGCLYWGLHHWYYDCGLFI